MSESVYAGIEAGGTKFVCALGTDPHNIKSRIQIPTTSPNETLSLVLDYLKAQDPDTRLKAIGVGSFGPVDLDPLSDSYGSITTTPKPGWANTWLAGILSRELKVPVIVDTDTNAAAYGEHRWGAGQNIDNLIYITIGTGIGGGIIIEGKPLHGLVHPEMGHMRLPHDVLADPFIGCCPYHGDCFEGLACGPAIFKRWGKMAQELDSTHPAWALESQYLALGIVNIICNVSPQRIIIGGGVMKAPYLLETTRQKVQQLLNGYIVSPQITEQIDTYIVSPGLGDNAGVLGAIAMARFAIKEHGR